MTTTSVRSRRDGGITALVEGFFASAWFGWGHQAQISGLETWLDIGSVVALLVAVGGAVVGLRSPASAGRLSGSRRGAGPAEPDQSLVLHDRRAARRYGITVGVEFGIAGAGAGVLGGLGYAEFIPVWVCAIVGLHFFALAPILRDRALVPLGVLTCAVAVAALAVGLGSGIDASAVTGVGAGCCLLAFGGYALAGAALPRPRPSTA